MSKRTDLSEMDWYEWKGRIWVKRTDMCENDWNDWKGLMWLKRTGIEWKGLKRTDMSEKELMTVLGFSRQGNRGLC